MKTGSDLNEEHLDALFAEAKSEALSEHSALMGRIFADAVRVQPQPTTGAPTRSDPDASGFWAMVAAFFGGRAVLAGLGTATVAGMIIGFAQPAPLTALTETFFAQVPLDEIELIPGIDAILTEG